MRRPVTALIASGILLLLMTAQVHARVIKIATISPDGSSWMELMRQGAKDVAKQTGKRVRFKFYPGGVMGNDKSVLRKISIGQLHGGAVMAGSLSKFAPDNQIYNLPLMFKSFKEVDYIRKRMDASIIQGIEKGGFVTFGLAEGGFAYLMSKMPVQTLDDLGKRKVWIPEGDGMALETVSAFDISPIPLSIADVRTALQTGLIDTVATSPIGAIALQWHTQLSYLLNVPLMYIYGLLAVDLKVFKKLSPDDQKIVRSVMGRIFREMDRQNRLQNSNATDALKNQGIKFLTPSTEALQELYAKAAGVSKRMIETSRFSPQLIKALDTHLKAYRSGQAK